MVNFEENVKIPEKVRIHDRDKISAPMTKNPSARFNKLELIKRIIKISDSDSLTATQKSNYIEHLIDQETKSLNDDEIKIMIQQLKNKECRNWVHMG